MNYINIRQYLFIKIRQLVNSLVSCVKFLDNSQIIVLCYHSIDKDNWRFSTDPEVFKKQVNYVLRKRNPITANDLYNHINGTKKLQGKKFLLTFDDGYKDLIKIRGFLKLKKIYPLLFVLSDPKNADRGELDTKKPFLVNNELLSIKKAGWTIGCHGATHANLVKINKNKLKNEITNSKSIIEKKINAKVDFFAYPKGSYNENIIKMIKKSGYKMAFSMDGGIININTNLFKIPRVGVDRTHNISEFPGLYTGIILFLRKLLV